MIARMNSIETMTTFEILIFFNLFSLSLNRGFSCLNENNDIISDALITCVCFDFDKQLKQPVYDLIKADLNK